MKKQVALIGYGAIGAGIDHELQAETRLGICQIVVPSVQAKRAEFAQRPFVAALNLDTARPDLVLECAGHAAIEQHVLPALRAGVPCMLLSVGALSEPGLVQRLEQAAQSGATSVQLLPGAVGGMDALAAARFGGLDAVQYEGRKPPLAWLGTPAETQFDLRALHEPTVIFRGSARQAAHDFPKNANVAATVALCGLGLDQTEVVLYADPSIKDNQHRVRAQGSFGSMDITLRGRPLAANPKTSALTVYSAVRALVNTVGAVAI